jgi:hypothetical protein
VILCVFWNVIVIYFKSLFFSPPTFFFLLLFLCLLLSRISPPFFSVYNQSLYVPLVEALRTCCHERSIVFLGLTRLFSKPHFFALLLDGKYEPVICTCRYSLENVLNLTFFFISLIFYFILFFMILLCSWIFVYYGTSRIGPEGI